MPWFLHLGASIITLLDSMKYDVLNNDFTIKLNHFNFWLSKYIGKSPPRKELCRWIKYLKQIFLCLKNRLKTDTNLRNTYTLKTAHL